MSNPPIVIGPFTNVPAPGSGVKSDWPQQISTYVAPTPWTDLVMQNAWAAYDAGRRPRYRKVGDVVELRGMMKSGTVVSVAFTLPIGFRPVQAEETFACIAAGALGSLSIASNGEGSPQNPTPNAPSYFTLNGIRFSTVL